VCLSVAFKFLNHVTLLQIRCEHYDGLGEHQEALGFVCRHLVLTEWRACELLWCERCRPYTVCKWIVEIRKNYFNSMLIESEKIKMATIQMSFMFFMMMKLDDWEEECQI